MTPTSLLKISRTSSKSFKYTVDKEAFEKTNLFVNNYNSLTIMLESAKETIVPIL